MRPATLPRSVRALVPFILVAAVLACGDHTPLDPALPHSVAAPVAQKAPTNPGPQIIGTLLVLQRATPLDQETRAEVLITPKKGGELRLKELGLKVTFPDGAVTEPTTVWVVAHPGSDVYYDFGPHMTFLKDVKIEQDLKYTNARKNPKLFSDLTGAYLPDGLADITSDGHAKIAEAFDVDLVPDQNDVNPHLGKFSTRHFSGYIYGTGFTRTH